MSDWVEYCNLKNEGKWSKLRIENGHPEPYGIKYWSIGNENYRVGEMGAKTSGEWGRFVAESAKMMKRVDPSIQLLAAGVPDLDWNSNLLREAGRYLDWISIHDYWNRNNGPEGNKLLSYEECMAHTMNIEEKILKTKYILGAMGYLGKIRIAFDEWNLRGWHHPNVDTGITADEYLTSRDKNDLNAGYTMADAVFSACFLNLCLNHCDIVGMANFSPTINTRGAIFTYPDGIVYRTTYHVFELYTRYMGDTLVDSWVPENNLFEVDTDRKTVQIPVVDIIATTTSEQGDLRIAIINRHPNQEQILDVVLREVNDYHSRVIYSLNSHSKDSYNDIDRPETVKISEAKVEVAASGKISLVIPPHSVHVDGTCLRIIH